MYFSSLTARVMTPSGQSVSLDVVEPSSIKRGSAQQQRPGSGNGKPVLEVRYEAIVAGEHELQVFLDDAPIKGSPVGFLVLPAPPTPQQCELMPPDNADSLRGGDLDQPSTAYIRTRDKFGNACISGGLRIAGRLNLVKQSNTDNTILMPNNHQVIIEDLDDGTYKVNVGCLLSCTVKLIVNVDRTSPAPPANCPPCSSPSSRRPRPPRTPESPQPPLRGSGRASPGRRARAARPRAEPRERRRRRRRPERRALPQRRKWPKTRPPSPSPSCNHLRLRRSRSSRTCLPCRRL